MTTTGPFQTEAEAQAASLYARTTAEWGHERVKSIAGLNLADLGGTCERARVEVGTYDLRVIEWLAQYEPATVKVIAGLISRAHEAGQRQSSTEGST